MWGQIKIKKVRHFAKISVVKFISTANHLGLIVGATVGGILFAIIILAVIVSLIDCLRKAFSPSVSYEVETHELN